MNLYLAIAEAERTAASFERPFSIALAQAGGYTPSLVKMFASEFMVARTLAWHWEPRPQGLTDTQWAAAKAIAQEERLPAFANFLNAFEVEVTSLAQKYAELEGAACSHKVAGPMWRKRKFPSALSKFAMAKSSWSFPPFDSHAANRLRIQGGAADKRARAFYAKLDKLGVHDRLQKMHEKLDGRLNLEPARILDKYLILPGMGATELAQAFADSQPVEIQKLWQQVAADLGALNFEDWLNQ